MRSETCTHRNVCPEGKLSRDDASSEYLADSPRVRDHVRTYDHASCFLAGRSVEEGQVQGLCTTNRSRRRALEIVKLCVHLFTNALPHVPSANEAATIRLQRTSRYEQAAVREIKQPAQGYAATNRG